MRTALEILGDVKDHIKIPDAHTRDNLIRVRELETQLGIRDALDRIANRLDQRL